MGKLVIEESVHVWGQEIDGKSLYLPLNFAGNLTKTALKNKIYYKKLL